MPKKDDCHATLLPEDENNIVKLIRQGNTIYKFAIQNGETFQRYVKHYGVIKVQQKIQNVMLYIINMDEPGPAEIQISTSLFQVKIDICPWGLSKKVFFQNPVNGTKYFGAKQQYRFIVCEKDTTTSSSGQTCTRPMECSSTDRNSVSKTDLSYETLMNPDLYTNTVFQNTGTQRNEMYNNDTELLKECIIEKGAMNDEEERLTKFLDVQNLNAAKLPKRSYKRKKGVFTRLFKFCKII